MTSSRLQQAVAGVFQQLIKSLSYLTPEQYTTPCGETLKASIGQHVRHIIELFICLEQGYEAGVVDYDKRKRDKLIETDKMFAAELLMHIQGGINKANKKLLLQVNYNAEADNNLVVVSNYYREVIYNLEHTIHHMALIRLGIEEIADIRLPAEFGVAPSTIKFKKAVGSA